MHTVLELITGILSTLISSILGVDLKYIKKVLDKNSLKDSGNLEISENIDAVSIKLEESKEIIENALLEMQNQKKLFEEMKKEAEISHQISTMNKEQVDALNRILESTLTKQEKKSFPKTFFLNLFFCILSAILGFIVGKIF